ncbi:MAG: EAL domain-containing protein [Thermoanaerobaculia bacterium]
MRGHTILIVDDDPQVSEAIAGALENPRRRIVVCSDIDAAAAVLERYVVSLVLTDVRMSHPFGYEGLELVRRVSAMRGTAGVVVMTGLRDPELDAFAMNNGAAMLLQKPFDLGRVESFLAGLQEMELEAQLASAPLVLNFPDIDVAIANAELGSVFQPIFDLRTGKITAVEALARHAVSTPLNDIGMLIEYAQRRRRMVDLDLSLLSRHLDSGSEIARRLPLFVNLHPSTLGEPERFIPHLMLHADQAGVALGSLVIEITEYAALPQNASALETFAALRRVGVRFALDDVGSAYSHLSLIDRIQPSFLKISQEFGTDFEKNQAHARIVKNIAQLGNDFGVDVIVEGIESAESAAAARELGIAFGQGYHFARPAAVSVALGLLEAAA